MIFRGGNTSSQFEMASSPTHNTSTLFSSPSTSYSFFPSSPSSTSSFSSTSPTPPPSPTESTSPTCPTQPAFLYQPKFPTQPTYNLQNTKNKVRTLFVANLSSGVKQQELHVLFSSLQGFDGCFLMQATKQTNVSPVCFVRFTTVLHADNALRFLMGVQKKIPPFYRFCISKAKTDTRDPYILSPPTPTLQQNYPLNFHQQNTPPCPHQHQNTLLYPNYQSISPYPHPHTTPPYIHPHTAPPFIHPNTTPPYIHPHNTPPYPHLQTTPPYIHAHTTPTSLYDNQDCGSPVKRILFQDSMEAQCNIDNHSHSLSPHNHHWAMHQTIFQPVFLLFKNTCPFIKSQ